MLPRLNYYLTAIPKMMRNITNWYQLPLLLISQKPLIMRLRFGIQFKVRTLMDAWIVKETCIDETYELYGTAIEDGWTVIDIGAGLGDFAIFVAGRLPNTTVFGFEPFPESFALFEENIALNQIGNITPLPYAISNTAETMRLRVTGAAVQHTTTDQRYEEDAAELVVEATSLDDLFAAHNIDHCDFIKLDCEGCEFPVLLTASSETLSKITHICLEYHDGFTPHAHEELVTHLEKAGFQVRVTPSPVHGHLGYLYAGRQAT